MRMLTSPLALLAAICLSSTAASAAGPAAPAPMASNAMLAQADAIIMQSGFMPVGQPQLKGNVIGSLARLGNKAFIVTLDARSGVLLDAKPTNAVLPPMVMSVAPPMAAAAPVPPRAAAPQRAVPRPQIAAARPARRFLPSYTAGHRGGVALVISSGQPRRPVRRRLANISLAALPKPSGFNRVLGPVYRSPTDGYFVVDPTFGAVALDPALFNAAVAVGQGLLDPAVLGPAYSPTSGYTLGFQAGLNTAALNSLQQPMFFDPTQGPVFQDPNTGRPVVYGPSDTPGAAPVAMPYVDPVQQQQFSQFAQSIVNSATPQVTDAAAQAAAQRLSAVPGLGTGQPLTDQQLGDIATAIGETPPPGGFSAQQKQDLQTIADHLTPGSPTVDPQQLPQVEQAMGNALGGAQPTLSEADQLAAQQKLVADPGVGSGHPLNADQLATLANAMGEPTPPGGFSAEQRQTLQEIASHITPAAADPQTLQNTAINQGIAADPADVNAAALSALAAEDPSALDPNAVAAVAAAKPGSVDPVALNAVTQADPQDASPDVLRQAAMANPGAVTPTTLDDVGQANPGFDTSGIAPADDTLQPQVDSRLQQADTQQPFMTFDSQQPDATQEDTTQPDTGPNVGQQLDAAQQAIAPDTAQQPDMGQQPAPAANAGDQGFSPSDFNPPGAPGQDATAQPVPDANGGDQGFDASEFNVPAAPADTNQPADMGTQDNTQPDMGAQDAAQPDATQQDATQQDNQPVDNAPARLAPQMDLPPDQGPQDNNFDNQPADNGQIDQGPQDNGSNFDSGGQDNSQMDNGQDNGGGDFGDSGGGDGGDSGGDGGDGGSN